MGEGKFSMSGWIGLRCCVLIALFALFPGQAGVAAVTFLPASVIADPTEVGQRAWPVTGHAAAELAQATSLPTLPATLVTLQQQADLIVHGRVLAINSRWAAQQRTIESVVTVQVRESMRGTAARLITLVAAGGYLVEEGLGMVNPHAASFAAGEEVLLLLRQQGPTWRVVGGAAGKFSVQGAHTLNRDWSMTMPTAALLATVRLQSNPTLVPFATLFANMVRREPGSIGAKLQELQDSAHPEAAVRSPLLASVSPSAVASPRTITWPAPNAQATYRLNTRSRLADGGDAAGADAVRAAVVAAATRWSGVHGADFTLHYGGKTVATTTGYNGVNEILFMAKGAAARAAAAEVWYRADGTIVEADIWINDDYAWAASDEPAAEQFDLQSALLHEFGHWLILTHSAQNASIMYPKLAAGRVKRTLHHSDQAGISAIYPR